MLGLQQKYWQANIWQCQNQSMFSNFGRDMQCNLVGNQQITTFLGLPYFGINQTCPKYFWLREH
jgi:hypothetical protein